MRILNKNWSDCCARMEVAGVEEPVFMTQAIVYELLKNWDNVATADEKAR